MSIEKFMILNNSKYLIEAKKKCETGDIQKIINKRFDDKTFSRLLFRTDFSSWKDTDVQAVNLQSLYKGLCYIFNPKVNINNAVIKNGVFLEFAKYIYLFDDKTKLLNMTDGVIGDNFLTSMDFFNLALSSVKNFITLKYQGCMQLVNVPIYLRLAIESHIKNTIGLISATSERKNKKGKLITKKENIKISSLINFFASQKYQKYLKLPIELFYLEDINFWANNYIHTGIPCSPWVSLSAILFLEPLFKVWTVTEDYKYYNMKGYCYLNRDIPEQELKKDLEEFLSLTLRKKITLNLQPRTERPVEGGSWDNS